jgi:hypothetical protein
VVIVELLTRERRSPEFIESDGYVLNRLGVEHRPDHGISGLPAEARGHAQRVGLYYDSLGMLSTFRGAHNTLLLGAVCWSVQVSWSVLEPYILAERLLRNSLYMSYFEHLVYLASTSDNQTLLRRQRLHRLPYAAAPQAATALHPSAVGSTPASAVATPSSSAPVQTAESGARLATVPGLVNGVLASALLPRRSWRGLLPPTTPHPTGTAPSDDAVVARLASEVVEARESATRADAKAATLLGVVGGASVIIVAVLAAGGRGDGAWTTAALIIGWIGAAMLTVATGLLVLAVRPHLRVLRPAGRQVSWMRFIGMSTPAEVTSAVRAEVAATQAREAQLAARLLSLAELAHRKHRLIRTAADLVLAATAVVAAAAVLYALVA